MSLEIIDWDSFLEAPSQNDPLFGLSAMTVGVFDGVHLGHKLLIEMIVKRGPNPTVITFRENPKKVVSPGAYEGDITSIRQKLELFEGLGVSRVVLIDFSVKFSKLNGWEFFEFLESRGVAFLAIGSNFRCGFQQKTDAYFILEMNKRRGIPTELVEPVTYRNGPDPAFAVSSSRIRSAICSGDLALARALMGRNFEVDLRDAGQRSTGLRSAGLQTEEKVFDLSSVQRISPKSGQYPVLVHPGSRSCRAEVRDGKVFLPVRDPVGDYNIESIEFLGE